MRRVRPWLAAGSALVATFALAASENQTCLECHSEPTLTMTKGDKEVSLFVDAGRFARSLHGNFSCTDCHEGFDPNSIPHVLPMRPASCIACHDGLGRSHAFHPGVGQSEHHDGGRLRHTAPSRGFHPERGASEGPQAASDVTCASCHGAHDVGPVAGDAFRFSGTRLNAACGACHEKELASLVMSAHIGPSDAPVPDCLTCHRTDVVDGSSSLLDRKLAQSKLCLSCHVDVPATAAHTRLAGKFVASWGSSVHGRALEGGNAEAANCVDCHGSHEMKRAMMADSRVNKLHITETCHTCHAKAADEWSSGAHAVALKRGELESPVCTDCHGEHFIRDIHDPEAAVAPRNVSQQLCGECHGSVRLSQRYGISSDRFQTFADSFHGLAARGGSVEVVNCSSCHGYHAILPSSDPRSPIHKNNIARTCGQCHPGANELFAMGQVHVSMRPIEGGQLEGESVVQIVATIYVWLIASVIGGMFIHNVLDFFKKWRRKVHGHVFGVVDEHIPHRLYLRMTVVERLQHATLVLSFVLLVVSGFMLRFPDAWWVVALRDLSDHIFAWRGIVHRVAAVAMVLAGVWHASYVMFTRRGRELFRDLWPRIADLGDMWAVLRYNLGLSKKSPQFKRFSYIEKAEYWALMWGAVVMTVTGVLLWADNTTMGLLGKLGFDISRTVHFYEAILASLAIVVWHFYFVIFNPSVYPMNLSWLTGYLSEEEMAEEHPLELERLKGLGIEGKIVPALESDKVDTEPETLPPEDSDSPA